MEIQKRILSDGSVRWKVRWRQGGRYRARTFDRKGDATNFAADVRRRQQVGTLSTIDSGRITLAEYVSETWSKAYRASLSESTRRRYGYLYDRHILPELGPLTLIEITPDVIARWQSDRLAAGGGPVAVRNAATLLGGILQRALESGHLQSNPARAVRKSAVPRRKEVRPLAPAVVERMRRVASPRDAVLISVLAYAGIRPGEALALQWRDVRDQTILIERALSLGKEDDTKTDAHRTVRLLAPLAADLREWRLRSGRPGAHSLVFPSRSGQAWTLAAYQSWRRRAFRRALSLAQADADSDPIERTCPSCSAAPGRPCQTPAGRVLKQPHVARGRPKVAGRPYDLRHSFASLLLHEGRSVIYVSRQLGHDARLTLSTYGHVIDELEHVPRIDAEAAIAEARTKLGGADRPTRESKA
ncbi:MAG: site-specific integrase [Solirubrobacteraceae bacterium]